MARSDTETRRWWKEFHTVVNMTSAELRGFLGSGIDDAYSPHPDADLDELSQATLRVLAKRQVDLTDADLDSMVIVVESIRGMLANPPDPAAEELNQAWRHTLMSVGHDPMRPDSPRGADAESDLGDPIDTDQVRPSRS